MTSLDASTDADLLAIEDHDHSIGSPGLPVSLVLYGDFQCPYTAKARHEVDELLEEIAGSCQFTYRHFPLAKHPDAYAAALTAEVASKHGKFWEMYALLFGQRGQLALDDLRTCAGTLGIDATVFDADLRSPAIAERAERDLTSGAASGVSGTPTFFVNGEPHYGDHSVELIREWVHAAAVG
jgi:protein-disulfide isomerase